MSSTTERHPLQPFLPENARILMLGSFPPPKARWSMDFFYPNWQNDMWRIWGIIFYNDSHFFEIKGEKRFDKEKVKAFCNKTGIALYDTASEIIRQKDNASDKFLEVVAPSDICAMLDKIPHCRAIVTTGEKATDVITELFGCEKPKVGTRTTITANGRELHFWCMPSSSRAYPLAIEKKALYYNEILQAEIGKK